MQKSLKASGHMIISLILNSLATEALICPIHLGGRDSFSRHPFRVGPIPSYVIPLFLTPCFIYYFCIFYCSSPWINLLCLDCATIIHFK